MFNFCEENKNMMAGQLKDEVLLQLMEDVVDKESVQTGLEVSYKQGCGSALIVCGSGSSKFGQCGSGSGSLTIK